MPYLNIKTYLGFGDTLHSRLVLVSWLPPILILLMFIGSWGLQSWVRCECCERPPDKVALLPPDASPKPPDVHQSGKKRRPLKKQLRDAWFATMPAAVWLGFFISVPISSYAFLAIRECSCFWLGDDVMGSYGTVCFSPADYSLRCPTADGPPEFRNSSLTGSLSDHELRLYSDTTNVAYGAIGVYAFGVPLAFALLLWYCRHNISGKSNPTRLSRSLSFLYSEYRERFFLWELWVTAQKQILVGVLSLSMFQPGQPVQLLLAIVFTLFSLLLVGWFHPYRKPKLNLLAVLSSASLQFIFLTFLTFELSGRYGVRLKGPVSSSKSRALLMPLPPACSRYGVPRAVERGHLQHRRSLCRCAGRCFRRVVCSSRVLRSAAHCALDAYRRRS